MRLLIVDDHRLARDAFCEWLRLHNWQDIYATDNLHSAQQICQTQQFDVAILDIRIPLQIEQLVPDLEESLNGLILGEWLRAKQPNCAILFISASAAFGTPVRQAIERMGARQVAYLLKAKAQPETLLATIEQILTGAVYVDPNVQYWRYPLAAQSFLDRLDADERHWIEAVYQRLPLLKEQQLAVIHLAVQGYKQKTIAKKLYLTENTVEKYLTEVNKVLFPEGVHPFIRPLVILGHALMLKALCDGTPEA